MKRDAECVERGQDLPDIAIADAKHRHSEERRPRAAYASGLRLLGLNTDSTQYRECLSLNLLALDGRSRRSGACGKLGGMQGVDAMTVENPNAKNIWTTIEIDKDGVETVLVVETDLELNAADPAFDVAKVDALIDAAMNSFATSGGTIDRVHLVPIR